MVYIRSRPVTVVYKKCKASCVVVLIVNFYISIFLAFGTTGGFIVRASSLALFSPEIPSFRVIIEKL